MPNPYSMIPSMRPSPTIFARQEDPLADPSPTVSVFVSQVPVVVVDNTPLPPIAMLAIKIYVFGGLAFVCGVILTGIAYWIYVVVVKGEFADSPPELDIHPERMREKEKVRIARLKVQKEEKEAERKEREEEKWRVPHPVLFKKKKQSRSRTSSTTSINKTRGPPPKPAIRNSSLSTTRTSSASRSRPAAKKKQVSWAPSISTLDGDGNLTTKPVQEDYTRRRMKSYTRAPRSPLREVPPARPALRPRRSEWIEERSARGPELIGTMDAEVVSRWARSPE